MNPSTIDTPDRDVSVAADTCQNRNRERQLIPEALARAHIPERPREAEPEHRAVRLAAARRIRRCARHVSLRVRRALAMAVK